MFTLKSTHALIPGLVLSALMLCGIQECCESYTPCAWDMSTDYWSCSDCGGTIHTGATTNWTEIDYANNSNHCSVIGQGFELRLVSSTYWNVICGGDGGTYYYYSAGSWTPDSSSECYELDSGYQCTVSNLTSTVPNIPAGTYYWYLVSDWQDALSESDEYNNGACSANAVTVSTSLADTGATAIAAQSFYNPFHGDARVTGIALNEGASLTLTASQDAISRADATAIEKSTSTQKTGSASATKTALNTHDPVLENLEEVQTCAAECEEGLECECFVDSDCPEGWDCLQCGGAATVGACVQGAYCQ